MVKTMANLGVTIGLGRAQFLTKVGVIIVNSQTIGALIVLFMISMFVMTHIKEMLEFLSACVLTIFLFGLLNILTSMRR